ncbi:serine protease grass [Drosophila takahashii]|uniref:serine protease grass n=1 Tax=Drosophila takahashii TaxID=29030 RepID=UPI003898DBA4
MRSAAGIKVIIFCLMLCPLVLARLLEPNCGIRADVAYRTRIIGGRNVQISAHPWMAYLHYESQFYCGGTLINRQFVLTAAHCLDAARKLTVRLGGMSLSSSDNSMCQLGAEDYEVDRAFKHKYFTPTIYLNDIAMLRLARSVEYNVHIRPICIILDPAMQRLVEDGMSLTATGWGLTDNGSEASDLQEASIVVMNRNICSDLYNVPVGLNQICAGDSETNTCMGDSGGPLGGIVNYYGEPKFVQYGLTSFGDKECRAPSVYTDLSTYSGWIEMVVETFGK